MVHINSPRGIIVWMSDISPKEIKSGFGAQIKAIKFKLYKCEVLQEGAEVSSSRLGWGSEGTPWL